MYRKRHRCVLTRAWATLVARPQAYRILLLQMYEYSLCARPGGQLGLLWVTSPWMITLHVPDDGMTPSGGGPRDWYVPSSLSLGGHLRITLHLQMVPLAWQRIGQHQIFTIFADFHEIWSDFLRFSWDSLQLLEISRFQFNFSVIIPDIHLILDLIFYLILLYYL